MSNTRRRYKPRPEAKVISYLGRNGARDVLLTVAVPHGEKTRDIKVPLEVDLILALADAIRCCPEHILETDRTGKKGPGPEARLTNIGHAVWHIENPDMPRPCLPTGSRIIDVGEAPARLGDGSPDDLCWKQIGQGSGIWCRRAKGHSGDCSRRPMVTPP